MDNDRPVVGVDDELRQRERLLHAMVDNALDAIALTQAGRQLRVNPAYARMFGFDSPEELLGIDVRTLIAPEHREIVDNHIRECARGGPAPEFYEVDALRRDGTRFTMEVHASAYVGDDQPYTLLVIRDVTERRAAEQALRDRERQVSGILENMQDVYMRADLEGRLLVLGPAAPAMFGYASVDEMMALSVFDLYYNRDDRLRVLQQLRAAGRVYDWPCQGKRKDGLPFWTSMNVRFVFDDQGRVVGTQGVLRDISESRRLGDRFRQAQKLEAIGQLAGGVAHDFNNVLASMMLHLGLVEQTRDLPDAVKTSVRAVLQEANRAASLTRQLLLFSRRSVMDMKSLDLNEVVANLLKMLGRLIGEQISLRFDRRDGLPLIRGDVGMLEQVLANLAVNARDAMGAGGVLTISTAVVTVSDAEVQANPEARAGDFVRLRVTDTGCGMDESMLKRIFEPFFTTKEQGHGTGLGLATVHGIVAQHQGWLEVESVVGRGSTFDVFLPAERQAGGEETSDPQAEPALRGTETLLLVEDASGLRDASARALRQLGYTVHVARSGPDALVLWKAHRDEIDLVFSDVVMPEGMTGIQLVARLRSDRPGLRCILASGYSSEIVDRGIAGLESVVYVPKPYRIEELSRVLRDCLDRK